MDVFVSDDVMLCYALKQTLKRQYDVQSSSDKNGIYGIWESQMGGGTWFISSENTISDAFGTYGFSQCNDVYVAHFLDNSNTCPLAFTYDGNEITLYTGSVLRKIS